MLALKEEINNVLQATRTKEIDLFFLASSKRNCVTKEIMMDFYNGGNSEFKKSLGDTLEDFMTTGAFSKCLFLGHKML